VVEISDLLHQPNSYKRRIQRLQADSLDLSIRRADHEGIAGIPMIDPGAIRDPLITIPRNVPEKEIDQL
jgi:hypothetical protein